MPKFVSLSSGSNGNCYYIGNDRTALLIDAGIGFRTIKQRLATEGIDVTSVKMMFVTHDHSDHVRGLSRTAGTLSVPVYATAKLHNALMFNHYLEGEALGCRRVLKEHEEALICGGDIRVVPFEVPHDATQTLGYFIDFYGTKFVFMTDLGRVPHYAVPYCREANYLIVESNYDVEMLMYGSYPPDLKARVLDEFGHLSNDDCAALLRNVRHPELRGIFLCHLSKDNNTPSMAHSTSCRALSLCGDPARDGLFLHCLPRAEVLYMDL